MKYLPATGVVRRGWDHDHAAGGGVLAARPPLLQNIGVCFSGVRHDGPSSGLLGRRSRAGGHDRGLPGLPACRLPGVEWSIRRTGDGCQGARRTPGGQGRADHGDLGLRRLDLACSGRNGLPDHAARPVAEQTAMGTPRQADWGRRAGQTPRCVRICSITSRYSMKAMSRIGPAHRGHTRGSIS